MSSTANPPTSAPRLRRSLTLWDLIMYGIIVIQPTALMPAYGAFSEAGQGDVFSATPFQIPYPGLIWPLFFAVLFTALILRALQTSAHINNPLSAIMGAG